MQETLSTPEAADKWDKGWKGNSLLHSRLISKASGVAILFRENSNTEITNSSRDQNRQLLKCSIQLEQDIFQLINIYATTKLSSRNHFYNKLQELLENEKKTIFPSDFNMIENIFHDRLGGNTTNAHTKTKPNKK